MNTLNLSDSILREVVHSTEWIADALNAAQGRSPTPADSQPALISRRTKPRFCASRRQALPWDYFRIAGHPPTIVGEHPWTYLFARIIVEPATDVEGCFLPLAATAASRILPWLPSGWECRGRRLSTW
jgi:hypothetical protein